MGEMGDRAPEGRRVRPVDLTRVTADRLRAVQQRRRVQASLEQRLIDAEVDETRRALLEGVRRHVGRDTIAFCDPDFLGVADLPTLYRAVLDAAVTAGRAERVDLQRYDRGRGVLRIAAQHGFGAEFLEYFAAVGSREPAACAAALAGRRPVAVDDVTTHEIFRGRPTMARMLDAGSRAVLSYPLTAGAGDVLGVLSFHYGGPPPRRHLGGLVAACTAYALRHVDGDLSTPPTAGIPGPR